VYFTEELDNLSIIISTHHRKSTVNFDKNS